MYEKLLELVKTSNRIVFLAARVFRPRAVFLIFVQKMGCIILR